MKKPKHILNVTLTLTITLTLILSMLIPAVFLPEPALANTSQTISRLTGNDRYDLAAEIARSNSTRADTVLLTFGGNHQEIVTAAPLADKHEAPVLLTRRNTLPEITKRTLTKLQVKNVIIADGTTVISPSVEAELKAMGLNVTRESAIVSRSNVAAGEKIDFGGYEWRVLDVRDGRALLLSEDVIESR